MNPRATEDGVAAAAAKGRFQRQSLGAGRAGRKKSLDVAKRKRARMQGEHDESAPGSLTKHVLVIDVGGSSVKILVTGQTVARSFKSGSKLTPKQMVARVKKLAAGWTYDVVSIGYPGPVLAGRVIAEPPNLGGGWVGFDFARSFGRPVKVVNDAAMQALGSYRGGKMLFLGLGTGLGTTMIVEGFLAPMELSHLPYKKRTYEYYVGRAGLERSGRKKWGRHVADVVRRLIAALQPDDTVIGGGNVTKLAVLPPRCRQGENANAFRGGFRLWANDRVVLPIVPSVRPRSKEEHGRGRKAAYATSGRLSV
jgi:polyphosphate glucokinase